MSSTSTPTVRRRAHTPPAVRGWIFGGVALVWYAASTFGPLDLPAFAVVFVLGVLVVLSVEPDVCSPTRGVTPTRRNVILALLAVVAFVAVAGGMNLLLGRIPIEAGHAVLATLAAICVALPRLAETRELPRPAVLGHRELVIGVTTLVAGVRAYQAGETVVAMVVIGLLMPLVMAMRRIRLGAGSPRLLGRRARALQSANFWLFLVLLAAASLPGTFDVWRIYAPDAQVFIVGVFWVGVAAAALLVAFPRRRISATANVLAVLASVLLAVSLVGALSGPRDAVRIGVPFTDQWEVASGGRSALVNNHWTLAVQRDAIDFVRLVDGKTYRGDRSRLENFFIFGQPLVAVADGRVTEAVDAHPDLPVGGNTWRDMAGNHVIIDIGGGHYVLYGHMKLGSLRVRVGDQVRRGQLIGQVGDSGNSDEPHLHIQVQNKPTFDVEDRAIRTYPILFDGATVSDLRRGDSVQPLA
jgi:Peptidase family M23